MKNSHAVISLSGLLLVGTIHADIYKCTDETGKVTLQDEPCASLGPDFQQATPDVEHSGEGPVKIWTIKGPLGAYMIGLPRGWSGETGMKGGTTTFRAKPSSGEDSVLLLSFLSVDAFGDDQQTAFSQFMERLLIQHTQNSGEKVLTTFDVSPPYMKGAAGRLVLFYDEQLAQVDNRGKGEFVYVWSGVVVSPDVLVHVSVLTDDPESENTVIAVTAVNGLANAL